MTIPKHFKIADAYTEFHQGEIFHDAREAWEALANFHEIDWTGEDDDGNPLPINEWLAKYYETDEEKLNVMLEHGQWEIEKIEGFTCPLCGNFAEHKHWRGTPIWSCVECNFIGLEWNEEKDTKELIDYLSFNK